MAKKSTHKLNSSPSSSSSSFDSKQNSVGWKGFFSFFLILFLLYLFPFLLQNNSFFLFHRFQDLLQSNSLSFEDRIKFSFPWILLPPLCLLGAILNMVFFRLHSPSDIDAGLLEPTKIARINQSIIQNTLEQTVLAIPIYILSTFFLPNNHLIRIPIASCLFFIGRISYMIGYSSGAPGRVVGFALTIIPTILLLFELIYYLLFI